MGREEFPGTWSQSAEKVMANRDEQLSGLDSKIVYVRSYVEDAFSDDSVRTYVTGDNIVGKVGGNIEKAQKYAERNPKVIPGDLREMGDEYPAAFILCLADKIDQNLN